MIITKKKGKSKVLSRGFRLFDSEADRRNYNLGYLYPVNQTLFQRKLGLVNRLGYLGLK